MNQELELLTDALIIPGATLEHHGIAGMKWGHLNGPPYPLGSDQLSSVEKKKNPGGSNEQQKEENRSNKSSLATKIQQHQEKRAAAKAEKEKQAKKDAAAKKRAATIAAKKKAEEDAAKQAEKDKADAEKREKDLYKLSPSELLDKRLDYSPEEIDSAMTRLKQMNSLQDVAITTAQKEQAIHEQNMKAAQRGADVLDVAVHYGQTAIKLYDVVATLSGNPTLEDIGKAKLDKFKKDNGIDKDTEKKLSSFAENVAKKNGINQANGDKNGKIQKLNEKIAEWNMGNDDDAKQAYADQIKKSYDTTKSLEDAKKYGKDTEAEKAKAKAEKDLKDTQAAEDRARRIATEEANKTQAETDRKNKASSSKRKSEYTKIALEELSSNPKATYADLAKAVVTKASGDVDGNDMIDALQSVTKLYPAKDQNQSNKPNP